jgi:DNA adenine methylase
MIKEPVSISLLRRLGNKRKLLPKLLPLFPKHEIWIEPFFGSGAVLFGKPLASYNYVNDIDNDVYNLFMVVLNDRQALYDYIESVPFHKAAWNWLKELEPRNDLEKAVKFVILSNWGYMGKPNTIRFAIDNSKTQLLQKMESTHAFLCKGNIMFNNVGFGDFFKQLSLREYETNKSFAYLDPPYLGTGDNYSHSFTEEDSYNLFEAVEAMNIKYAMSEFAHPFIISEAKRRGLRIENLGERQSMKNRNTEILVMNYVPEIYQSKLFL